MATRAGLFIQQSLLCFADLAPMCGVPPVRSAHKVFAALFSIDT